jgi:TPR repeat protein
VLGAQNNLSVLYGTGCPNLQADEKSAVFYLKMAANSGEPRAQANLAERTASGEHGVEKNPYEAYALALKSVAQKDPHGRFVLAEFYAGGVGVPADAKKAFDLIKQGSLDKSEEDLQQRAQFAQAGMHEAGEGTSRNLDESYKWYLIAAAGPKSEIAKQAKAAATGLEARLSAEAIHKAQDGAQQWLREHRGTAISADELFDEAKKRATGDDKSALVAARAMAAIGDARGETISGALSSPT